MQQKPVKIVVMYYTPGHFFAKSATGCLVHHYSPFDGNYTLEILYGQFDGNYMFFKLMGKDGGVPELFSIYWCEQASSAAQVCKEINEAKRSAIYLQNEQGMDDAQRAEKRRLGGKSSKSDGLKLRRNKNRCWFPDLGFQILVSREALGNKSGSFCEAVNCERSEQEGKFLFAMLVSSAWFSIF